MTDFKVVCEDCGKEIREDRANCYYKNNNYVICCSSCYDKHKADTKEVSHAI